MYLLEVGSNHESQSTHSYLLRSKVLTYHSTVFLMPSASSVLALNPNASMAFVVSRHLLGCPSGFVLSKTIVPLNPTVSATKVTKSVITISLPEPRLTGSDSLYCS